MKLSPFLKTMPIRYPRPLRPGDTIAVVSPSAGVRAPMHSRLDAALQALASRGLVVREGALLRQQTAGASGTAAERAAELMNALLDDDVTAVIPPWGGELAIEILRLLDFDRLARVRPKWLTGFSDISTVQLPMLLRLGWGSVHGPNLMQFPDPPHSSATAALLDLLYARGATTPVQRPLTSKPSTRLDGNHSPTSFSGRLLGGCLDSISRLAGTPVGDVQAFNRRHESDGVILFIENAELKPFEMLRALTGLRLAGWFDNARGVLLGRNAAVLHEGECEIDEYQAVARALDGIGCPVLLDVDIGHVVPQWSLVQGAIGTCSWEAGAATLRQELR